MPLLIVYGKMCGVLREVQNVVKENSPPNQEYVSVRMCECMKECVCVCTRTHTHSSRCVSRLWGLGGVEAGNSWDTCAQKERFTGGEEVTTDK